MIFKINMSQTMYNANKLHANIIPLYHIHRDSASSNHAILNSERRWKRFIPTNFIYVFFTFNTLYNVDWEQSLRIGRKWIILNNREDIYEFDKIEQYINFCCKDEEFLKIYKDFFRKYVTHRYSSGQILSELHQIQVDKPFSNGRIWNEDIITHFLNVCHNFLENDIFDKHFIKGVARFVYYIRCNLFHGVKTMDMLNEPAQQIRLEIYTLFIIAINQMVFSYIEYLNGCDINKSFSALIDVLKWKNCEL